MRHPVAILAVAAVALAACERPANTAYNNSGQSAATAPGPMVDNTSSPDAAKPQPESGAPAGATTRAATSDTASPSVAPVAGATDETETSRRIIAALTTDSGLKDADVSVKTENGVVTLGGTAKSQDQVALATDIARRQEGVARVESHIALR